ncbi:MAG: type III-A CRISPR-associated protein Csm2 [Dethiobacteria bacterium]|jgi:CRISPR-associated protein Csm2
MSNDMEDAFRKAGYQGTKQQRAKSPQAKPASNQFVLGKNYTAQADQVIQELAGSMGRDYQNFTTSKIRNILAMVSEIYNDVISEHEEALSLELQSRIEYLKVRLVYECGREPRIVKPFVSKAGLLELLNNIGDNREKFINFARYMEALVAYHRFRGGRDS